MVCREDTTAFAAPGVKADAPALRSLPMSEIEKSRGRASLATGAVAPAERRAGAQESER